MSDSTPQPNGTGSSGAPDPWAPPEDSTNRVPLEKPGAGGAYANPVHDQPTVTSMPGAGADGMPGAPGAPTVPGVPGAPGAPAAYGYPSAPGASPGEYGYPPAYPSGSAPGGAGPYPGYPGYPGPGGWTGAAPQPQNGFGIAAMVLGILSLCLFCVHLGVVLGPLALIFGVLGRKKAARGEATNPGMALAGIITGSIGIAVAAAFLGFVVWSIVAQR